MSAGIEKYLEEIENILEKGSKVPLSNKTGVDANAIHSAIENIRLAMPNELAQARTILADRNNILSKAKNEAVAVVTGAEEKSRALIAESEDKIRDLVLKTDSYAKNRVAEAEAQAKQLVATATEDARIIRENAQAEAAGMVEADEIVIQARATAESVSANAQSEAQALVANANAQAEQILAAANEQAQNIRNDAQIRADNALDSANKWSGEIRLAAVVLVLHRRVGRIGHVGNKILARQPLLQRLASSRHEYAVARFHAIPALALHAGQEDGIYVEVRHANIRQNLTDTL